MEVLVHEHLLALRRRELPNETGRDVAVADPGETVLEPGRGLVLERVEARRVGPEPRHQLDQDVERVLAPAEERNVPGSQRSSRSA